jgi:hypothetical protein
MAPARRPSAPSLVVLVEGEKGGVRPFCMPPVVPSPDLRRGGHPGAAFGECPRTSTWRTRSESFACEAESFACERFSFRIDSAKPLKSFMFSTPRIRSFQCYQRLAADSVSRFFSMTFSRRWAELGHCFSLPNNSRYHRSAFWKTKFRRRPRIVSGPARGADGLAARSDRSPRTTPSELEFANAVIHLIELVG